MQDKAIQESDAAPETKMLVEAQEMNLATAKNILKDKIKIVKAEKAEVKLQQEKITHLKEKINKYDDFIKNQQIFCEYSKNKDKIQLDIKNLK